MGIYSASTTLGGYNYTTVEPALESANYTAMALEAVAESERNYNMIMKAIAVNEASYFAENGTEVVYEAGGFSGFIAKIKEFFVKLWNKIKEIFHKFLAWLDSLVKNDKDFAKKYREEANRKWEKIKDEFSIKGYKFTNIEKTAAAFENAGNKCKNLDDLCSSIGVTNIVKTFTIDALTTNLSEDDVKGFKKMSESLSSENDIGDKVRGFVCNLFTGASAEKSETELTQEIFEYLRDGESHKTTLDKSDIEKMGGISNCLLELESYESTKKASKKAFDAIDKSLKTIIKTYDAIEKGINAKKNVDYTVGKETKDALPVITTLISRVTSLFRNGQSALVSVNGAYLQALKDRAAQDKQIVVAVIATNKVTKESARYDSYSESTSSMSFLNNVVLK